MIIDTDNYISLKEKAKMWGICHSRMYHFLHEDKLPGAVNIGNKWFVPKDLEKPYCDGKYVPKKYRR